MLIDEIIESDYTYLIRELGSKYGSDAVYQVAKFTGNKEPSAVYTVSRRGTSWHCDCPGFARAGSRKAHKHIEFIRAWIAKGKPDPIDTPGFQNWAMSVLSAF